jgi:tRNA(fMet)-specific endonuclease VapC
VNGRLVLDTNAVIDLIRGDVSLRELVSQSEDVFIPSTALGELYLGAYQSNRVAENVDQIDGFVRSYAILRVDESTAKNLWCSSPSTS